MYCGCNKTALTSQRQIAGALLSLMDSKPFDQISVCELCRAAEISRQTFYSLFSSRENVLVFILQEKYFFTPEGAESDEDEAGSACCLRSLCREYSEYIVRNREFLHTLVQNRIDYLLYDSVYDALMSCEGFLPKMEACTRRYAASFYAGGISSVARCFAGEGCTSSEKELEEMLYLFFSGKLF